MANEKHLKILKRGVDAWNKWRKANPDVKPDLSDAAISDADLKNADLWSANLRETKLIRSNLNFADLSGADLSYANIESADLKGAKLIESDLRGAKLIESNLSQVDFRNADLYQANLNEANLYGANLTNTNLAFIRALYTNFEGATLTGACIEDWHINADTNLKGVICDCVYLKGELDWSEWSERRPSDSNKNFAPGEFTTLFQKALETIDLIFADGIDWRAFFQSFQELQSQYANQELSIQAIEKKAGGAFVIRLETPFEVDKAAIEAAAMEKYQAQLHLLESQYRTQLYAKDEQIEIYRHQNTSLLEVVRSMASKPVIITNTNNNTVEANSVSNSQSSGDTYNGTIKATNFAPHGTAIGGTFNDYSQTITNNLDEIQQLITTLRSQAEQFPQEARNEVLEHLNDLQEDLQHPNQVKPSRLKATFAALLAITVGVATATDFANNVLELGKKFGVELVHPQRTHTPQAPPSPHPQGTLTVDVKRLEGGH